MKDELAERLLAEVMKWTREDVARERSKLQALAHFKYDEYQQFSPGMHFIESLALWLAQFDLDEERRLAYEFIRSNLIFVSADEIAHLVTIAFPDVIRPFLISRVATDENIDKIFVKKIENSNAFKIILRQSLFLGLSDGAHMDLFRRSNPKISHEQIYPISEISDEKANDMLDKLAQDLEKLNYNNVSNEKPKFRLIFLIDDFSGSGRSYFREDNSGKVYRILNNVVDDRYTKLRIMIDPDDLYICVLLYMATEQAKKYLEKIIQEWLENKRCKIQCNVHVIKVFSDNIRIKSDHDNNLIELFKKYFDESIMDEHYCMGNHQEPYLGFDQCALPLILSHNTPNNTIPLLWFDEKSGHRVRGLFPRVNRHKGEAQ